MTRSDEVVLALSHGRLPDGVDERSREGQYYRRLIDVTRANIARAPEPTEEQLGRIVPVLRAAIGGGHVLGK